jgi:hypothetical protein
MPEAFLLFFILTTVYFIMKKLKSTAEKPVATATKIEQSAAPIISQTGAKKTSTAQQGPTKTKNVESKAKSEQPPAPELTKTKAEVSTPTETPSPQIDQPMFSKTTLKKPNPAKKGPKKAEPTAVSSELPAKERTGLTAGSIWQYLAENGPTSVAKLIKELPEEEKIIQRSIGWLAQEGKITLDTVDRIETIALKG